MIIEKRLYAPKECIVKNGGILAISLSSVYAAINKGTIPTVKVGSRRLIPYWYLESLIYKSGKPKLNGTYRPVIRRQLPSQEVLAKY